MKILILADHSSSHTYRWVKALCEEGITVYLFSLSDSGRDKYEGLTNFHLEHASFSTDKMRGQSSGWSKISYLKEIGNLRAYAKQAQPDIVHAHYASSYGLLGLLLGYEPFVVSVWGSDVYDFPTKSILHRFVLKRVLSRAKRVFSTSENMAERTANYTSTPIEVIPFGIDLKKFTPKTKSGNEDALVIGTIKSLEEVYGIDNLIRAFALVQKDVVNCRLLIVGDGSMRKQYEKLVDELQITGKVTFTGKVPHSKVAEYYHKLDIYAALSRRESFGVAILEASACGLPVVVTNVGGLPEVVQNERTGCIVDSEDILSACNRIKELLQNSELRKEMGQEGVRFVQKKYNWQENINAQINAYKAILK